MTGQRASRHSPGCLHPVIRRPRFNTDRSRCDVCKSNADTYIIRIQRRKKTRRPLARWPRMESPPRVAHARPEVKQAGVFPECLFRSVSAQVQPINTYEFHEVASLKAALSKVTRLVRRSLPSGPDGQARMPGDEPPLRSELFSVDQLNQHARAWPACTRWPQFQARIACFHVCARTSGCCSTRTRWSVRPRA